MNGLGSHSVWKSRKSSDLLMLAALYCFSGTARAEELPCGGEGEEFTSSFRLDECQFKSTGTNPYFILKPGRRLVLEGDGERVLITVLRETHRIKLEIGGRLQSLKTRVVEEREYEDGELKEVSRNFFAICAKTNDVFYFGEEVDDYEDCEIVGHGGEWLAGKDGAMPGIIMPGTFLLGSRYFQEIACDVALDRAEHVKTGLTVETPFGVLENCVQVRETSPLDHGAESTKVYAPGIGLVVDNDIRLVDVIENVKDDDHDDCEEDEDEDDDE